MSKIIKATKSQQKNYSHNINIGKVIPIKNKL